MASPELQAVVEMLGGDEWEPDLESQRARLDAIGDVVQLAEGVQVEPVDAGGVPCEWLWAGERRPTAPNLLYLHGGAYVAGSLKSHRGFVSRLAVALGGAALNVDYGLAPEHPFPAAVDDAVAAYRWLLGQGAHPRQVVVAGDSAGGGLALALLVALRDAGDPLPAAGTLISPWTDLTASGDSMTSRAELDVMLDAERLLGSAADYLGGASPEEPLASPVFADLGGLPPLLLQVGDPEVLLDDSVRVARAAEAAGTVADLRVWPECFHVWMAAAGMVPEADEAVEEWTEWVHDRLGR
jgi:monoterpene epsilon-lactone hydrolase